MDEDTSAFMRWMVTARMGRMGRMDWMGRWWLVGRGWDRRTLAPAGTGAPEQERHHWILRGGDVLAGYCQHGVDGTDGLHGVLVGRGWDG